MKKEYISPKVEVQGKMTLFLPVLATSYGRVNEPGVPADENDNGTW